MKLSFDQLQVLKDGARLALERYLANAKVAANAGVSAYWATEAVTARQLADLLSDALTVEIESVQLTPPMAAVPMMQTDHPPMPAPHLPPPSVPHNESVAIRDLHTLLALVPPSKLLCHPRLLAMKHAVQRDGPAALEGILTLRSASPASDLPQHATAPHAPAPSDAQPPAPESPAHAHHTAGRPDKGTASPSGELPNPERLRVLPKSSAQPTSPDPHAASSL